MGCNCGGRRPTGWGTVPAAQQAKDADAIVKAQAQKKASEEFVLRTTSGRTSVYGSRLEAEAARIRSGGGSIHVR